MEEVVKVIGSRKSLFSARIEWGLKMKGVEYEFLEEDVRNKSQTLLKYNPVTKKIPVFLHGNKAIPESLVILEYIDEVWKETLLLPRDPLERATARFWAKFGDEKVLPGLFQACVAQGEEKRKAIESGQELLAILEKEISGKKYFGGESLGYLDLAMGWIPLWLGVLEEVGEAKILEAQKFPSLHEWSQSFMDIPVIKQCLPPREELLEYFTASFAYIRSLDANKS